MFESFLSLQENVAEIDGVMQRELDNVKTQKNLPIHEYTKEMDDVFHQYNEYVVSTQEGAHGKTAQFWLRYIKMIHLYHQSG